MNDTLKTIMFAWINLIVVIMIVGPKFLKRRKGTEIIPLNKNTIVKDSNSIYNLLTTIIVMGFFVFMALSIIPSSLSGDIKFNIFIMVFIGVFMWIPLTTILTTLLNFIRLVKGDYYVIEDILINKIEHRGNENHSTKHYYIFENYKETKEKISVDMYEYDDSEIGDRFYLVICRERVYVFNTKRYVLDTSDRSYSFDKNSSIF